jgi:hypothetical protein
VTRAIVVLGGFAVLEMIASNPALAEPLWKGYHLRTLVCSSDEIHLTRFEGCRGSAGRYTVEASWTRATGDEVGLQQNCIASGQAGRLRGKRFLVFVAEGDAPRSRKPLMRWRVTGDDRVEWSDLVGSRWRKPERLEKVLREIDAVERTCTRRIRPESAWWPEAIAGVLGAVGAFAVMVLGALRRRHCTSAVQ